MRFFLPPEQCEGSTLFVGGAEAHHALRVLRVRRGDRVTVLDGAGREFLCEVQGADCDKIQLSVLETKSHPPPACRVTLLQALPKGKLIESIIQKSVELGVFRIVPLLTDRVVHKLSGKEAARKAAKWQAIAVEAIKQCGSPWLPRIEPPLVPASFIARKETFELPLIASLQNGSRHPGEYFETFRARNACPPQTACVWIGPEGDFTAEEVEAIQRSGAHPITLGPLVLRTETAAIYGLSVINYEIAR